MAEEDQKPQQPAKTHTQRAAHGAAKRMADEAEAASAEAGLNICDTGRQVQAARQLAAINGPRLGNLENSLNALRAKLSQLNAATQVSFKEVTKRIDAFPCIKHGVCPPAQRTTATLTNPQNAEVAPPDALVEVGHLDENGKPVITAAPQQENTEVPMTNPSGRSCPVREADDDELADELLEREERRARRQQRRAQLQVGLGLTVPQLTQGQSTTFVAAPPQVNPQVTVTAEGPSINPGMTAKEQLAAVLEYQKQFHEPWYKNKFFHTTWGFILLFVIVTFFDSIVGLFGYTTDEEGNIISEENAAMTPAESTENTPVPPPIQVNVDGINAEVRQQYVEWQNKVNLMLDDAYAHIVLAREKVAAVKQTAGGGRLYPAEDDYLEDAIRLLDETAGMMAVQESEESDE